MDKKKDIEALKGFVHTGPSSPWTGMRYRSLIHQYPREYLRSRDEKDRGDGEHRPPRGPSRKD
jgi:hypothetical protein